MKPLVIASNMLNEINQLEEWFAFVHKIADAGIIIVDSGSTDGTIEFCKNQPNTIVVVNDTIQKEGYGRARTELRELSKKHFPIAHWCLYLDADERIDESDFHTLRCLKDNLEKEFDVIALPRIDWIDKEKTKMAKDWIVNPDWQARMTRLKSNITYVRKLHEQIQGHKNIYHTLECPKINHFHRIAGQDKRDQVGRLCAKLHAEDNEFGQTYPKHHKEDYYYKEYEEKGL